MTDVIEPTPGPLRALLSNRKLCRRARIIHRTMVREGLTWVAAWYNDYSGKTEESEWHATTHRPDALCHGNPHIRLELALEDFGFSVWNSIWLQLNTERDRDWRVTLTFTPHALELHETGPDGQHDILDINEIYNAA